MFKQCYLFLAQVLAEAQRLDKPSVRDLADTALRVLLVVCVASALLLGVDWLVSILLKAFLRI